VFLKALWVFVLVNSELVNKMSCEGIFGSGSSGGIVPVAAAKE
jgi:hypothetical protein